ncbi:MULTISPECIES: MurR/RpiR family transcriptional regulator [Clostridium]|uniref:Transcriptional regulator, RpiR family n=1 Tax=Clostridium cadaveris TaxID=1529 RepID=A0A1I2K6R0_9CLOT|nr:MurR/RpiR family transcriptional regulator [Clostridium cadaveris]MDU4950970.1 MurR/RpiR family transcriptional regulator [Clostridium sp.]MDM8312177.1 MurR/RpiR family transcriptional regulator [Clostridium cadaveris]MDY4949087.1 MurR/RpiR family transcriptional regulator [Clostridium cadaveris]NME64043.1 MurR/RpiR family transcriptional regulator [Clostridium cadaveris]NWK12509.1 MurR/RpiR family transcriptional regulator [Clostridium cadaveris]
MSYILKIEQHFEDFTQSERKIAKYILENRQDVITLSTQEIGILTDTSPASVVRFSRTLGYEGFQDLKLEIAKTQNQDEEKIIDDIIEEGDSIEEVVQKVANQGINTINNTVALLNIEDFEMAINEIKKAKNIYLFGVGASAIVAMDLQHKLLRINKIAVFHPDANIQLAMSVHANKGDLVIGISYRGRSKDVNNSIRRAKANGASCLSITKYGNNPLADLCDINLRVPNVEKELRVGAIASRMAQLMVTDILFLGIAKDNFEEVEKYLKSTKKMTDMLKE